MGRTPYRRIPKLLQDMKPFEGNSMSAKRTGKHYVVRSYNTDIASTDGERRWITEQTYSRTTTRQTNLCRAWLPGEDV